MQGSSQELGACKGTGPLSSRRVKVDSESGLSHKICKPPVALHIQMALTGLSEF